MSGLRAAVWAEALKARRSRVPLVTALGVCLAPLMGGFFMVVLKDPDRARRLGLIGTKAQLLSGTADWPTYLGVLAQATAVGGVVLFGLATVWVFGREYSNRTVTDLLALPTGRAAIVAAKFLVVVVWSAGLVAVMFLLGLVVGGLVGLPGWSLELAVHRAGTVAATGGLTVLLVSPLAFAASAGRGYLPAIGVMFLMVFLAQVVAAAGWGAYFPWSVPALYSGIAGPEVRDLGGVSYVLVGLAGVAGVLGTFAWWRTADHT
ncbi:MAG TPA: ABC transporter permease [Actinomycetes bacterium]|jgi:ABC-2 type transport system permease protein|nr:ABC transporter permease [Actinomycetes bacterium]